MLRLKGGIGSGHFGHKGRPGQQGGSLSSDSLSITLDNKNYNTITLPKIEILDSSLSNAKKLNTEWDKTYKVRTGGPFWDVSGELNAKYYIIRDNAGKLIAGATTKQRGFGTEILSISSTQAGEGIKLLNELKRKNVFLYVMSSSKNSDKWYEKFGFHKDNTHPNQYNYVWKKG
ncbi:MAG: hypothetical protein WC479_00640 [Candidatus Izemoplasmatales bacterium]